MYDDTILDQVPSFVMLTLMGIFSFDYPTRGLLGARTELDEGGRNQSAAGLFEAGSSCWMWQTL